MLAVRFHRHGPPADVLQVDDVPTPEPGPGTRGPDSVISTSSSMRTPPKPIQRSASS